MDFFSRADARAELVHINSNSGHAGAPPRSPVTPWLAVERFEYERAQDHKAVLQLLAMLPTELSVPAGAMLVVHTPGASSAHAPFGSRMSLHRPSACRGEPGSGLLWRASFALSLEIVEYPQAVFSLFADERVPVALPAPVLTSLEPAAETRVVRFRGARVRRHLVALTAGLVVAAASGSVVGVASARAAGHAAAHPTAMSEPVALARPATLAKAVTWTRPRTPTPPVTVIRSVTVVKSVSSGSNKAAQPGTPGPTPKAHRNPKGPQTPPTPDPIHRSPFGQDEPRHDQHRHDRNTSHTKTPAKHHHRRHHDDSGASPHHDQSGTSLHHDDVAPTVNVTPAAPAPAPAIAPQVAVPVSPAALNPDAFTAAAFSQASSLLAAGDQPPAFLIPIYKAAAKRYQIPWQILAAINWVETDYGANLSTSSAGAIGWMQFMPGTWQEYGVAADGRGQPNPYSPQDAIFSAAHYLAANGAAKNLPKAIYAYNHAAWYVVEVMWRAQIISDHSSGNTSTSLAGAGQSGLAGAETMLVAAYSAVGGPYSQANHDSFGQTAADLRRSGTDCSGFVSWVLDQVDPGFGNQTTVTLPDQPGILPGVGQYTTMWDRPLPGDQGHVIINILGAWFESGGNTAYNPAGGIAPMSEAQAVGELTGGGFLPYHLTGL